jgi:hypothetical protein
VRDCKLMRLDKASCHGQQLRDMENVCRSPQGHTSDYLHVDSEAFVVY